MRPKRELVRVVRTPAGEVRVDASGKVAGRGAYVCPSEACAALAVRDGRLERALAVALPDDVVAQLRAEVAQRARAAGAR